MIRRWFAVTAVARRTRPSLEHKRFRVARQMNRQSYGLGRVHTIEEPR